MIEFRRQIFGLMIPAHLCCLLWITVGRTVLSVEGLTVLITLFALGPIIFFALLLITLLAYAARRPSTEGYFTTGQALAHCALWLSMFGFGLCLVDSVDGVDHWSVLTTVIGASKAKTELSETLTNVFAATTAASYLVIVVLLLIGFVARRRRAADGDAPPG